LKAVTGRYLQKLVGTSCRSTEFNHITFAPTAHPSMECLAARQHFDDSLHPLLARIGSLGGLQAIGDGIQIGLAQRFKKRFRLLVRRELLDEVVRD
jgi:hypothetical protein